VNTLYPVFFKLENIQMLLVGAGIVGTEKLSFILKNSPNANITIVAIDTSAEIETIAKQYSNVKIINKAFEYDDLKNKQLVIAATNIKILNEEIYHTAKAHNILVNVADTPALCDFYLGSIVTKGNLKIALSTNGKSPTLAKRLREMLEEILPEDINELLDNLQHYRNTLKGNFEEKVQKLNELTKAIFDKKSYF
jgi:precorrin-2 dehydrogenase/sirohydrochlorin ferrochelatase